MNGQNQGQLSAKLLRDIGLGMVSKHIIVHIDASRCDKDTRQKLFATTRENLKDDTVLRDLLRTLTEMLKNDSELQEIERELTDQLTANEAEKGSDEVKKQIIRLLEEAGMTKTQTGPTDAKGADEQEGSSGGGGGGGGGSPKEPLETLPFPEVTRMEIVSPKTRANIPIDGRTTISIETDADEMFETNGLLSLNIDSTSVEVASFTALRGGRKQWRLRPTAEAQVGNFGRVQVVLAKPTGETLTASIPFYITEKKPPNSKVVRGNIPDFDVRGIHPVEHADTWERVWPNVSRNDEAAVPSVAFTIDRAGNQLIVYYSKVFGPFAAMVDKLKNSHPSLLPGFETSYKVWIGYHAILQQQQGAAFEEDAVPGQSDSTLQRVQAYMEAERSRIATVQVKQSLEVSRLQLQLTKEGASHD